MEKLNFEEMKKIDGGGFWDGVCTGFGFGSVGIALLGISTGPLGFAIFTSVGTGCAIHAVTDYIREH